MNANARMSRKKMIMIKKKKKKDGMSDGVGMKKIDLRPPNWTILG